ncbi:hypothetical protein QRD44_17785 [Pseudomonas plecoglossicida]|uniref:hypothetical protein n=1 Tax=Pseudomonas plecoglossicida TaxID=70775 RepID=UPI003D7FD07F
MNSWQDIFDQCAENRRLLDTVLKPGAEVTCTRSFSFLPLRYGAMGGSEAQRRLLPQLPAHLRRPFQVGPLGTSEYALRPPARGLSVRPYQAQGQRLCLAFSTARRR